MLFPGTVDQATVKVKMAEMVDWEITKLKDTN